MNIKKFEETILTLYKDAGKVWFDQLPSLVNQIANAWHLKDLKVVENLSYNYVVTGIQHDKQIVLKLSFDIQDLACEYKALKAFDGYGMVKVLEYQERALLLERIVPGDSLKIYFPEKEDASISSLCELIKKLQNAPILKDLPENYFETLEDWLKILDRSWPQIPQERLLIARRLKEKLLKTTTKNILLHGDLHHTNILKDHKNWIAIDPKGIIGDPAYEIVPFIFNPIDELVALPLCGSIIKQRIRQFAQLLTIDEKRIHAWCYVHEVMSTCWSLEGNYNPANFTDLTYLFETDF